MAREEAADSETWCLYTNGRWRPAGYYGDGNWSSERPLQLSAQLLPIVLVLLALWRVQSIRHDARARVLPTDGFTGLPGRTGQPGARLLSRRLLL